ncbi:tetratricopeptide repeat protein [Streptomyces sp. NPDC048290]|uniref:ATP-binding protein n=1 Tax=Streptomyces sp. NPDC048290 TaxID=3155811 RepID=UPI003442588C
MEPRADRFWAELRALYEAAGRPTLSSLVALGARQRPPLTVADSSLHEWLHGRTVPGPRHTAFVLVLVAHLQTRARGYEERPEGWWRRLLTDARHERDRARGGRPGGRDQERRPPTAQGPVTLPPEPTGFTGRAEAVERVMGWLAPTGEPSGVAAVSVVAGMGGVGKTALALHTAHRAHTAGWFPGGVLFADLHGHSLGAPVEPGAVADQFLRALGVKGGELPRTVEEKLDLWRMRLDGLARQGRPLLIVLDNARGAAQTAPLLPGPPHHALLTSRQALSGLSAQHLSLDPLDADGALGLLDRALRAGGTGDDRVADVPEDAARLVALCGHLPLALRIIAALLRDEPDRSLADQAADLADARTRLDALDYADTDDHGHPLAVRATFDLSYRRLSPAQARVFRLLSAAPGPDLSTRAAAALLGAPNARPLLAALARAHLLRRTADERWSLHDLLQLYALEKGEERAEEDRREEAVVRLTEFYVGTVEAACGQLVTDIAPGAGRFTGVVDATAWLEAERANLVALTESPSDTARAASVPLTVSLAGFLERRRYLADWITLASHACTVLETAPPSVVRVRVLNSLGQALGEARRFDQGADTHRAALAQSEVTGDWRATAESRACLAAALLPMRRLEECVAAGTPAAEAYRERDDGLGEASILMTLGLALTGLGRISEAVEAHVRACRLFSASGSRRRQATALNALGNTLQLTGQFEPAIAAHMQSAALYSHCADPYREAMALFNLAAALREFGVYEVAVDVLTSVLGLVREHGGPSDEALALDHLGIALTAAGRPDEGVEAHDRALAVLQETGDLRGESACLSNLGLALVELGRHEEAAALHAQAVDVARAVGHLDREGIALSNLGTSLRLLGRIDEALDAHHAALAVFRAAGEHRREIGTLFDISRAHEAAGRLEEAVDALAEGLPLTEREPAEDALLRCQIGELLWRLGRFEEAVASGLTGAALFRRAGAERDARTAGTRWTALRNGLRRRQADGGASPYTP